VKWTVGVTKLVVYRKGSTLAEQCSVNLNASQHFGGGPGNAANRSYDHLTSHTDTSAGSHTASEAQPRWRRCQVTAAPVSSSPAAVKPSTAPQAVSTPGSNHWLTRRSHLRSRPARPGVIFRSCRHEGQAAACRSQEAVTANGKGHHRQVRAGCQVRKQAGAPGYPVYTRGATAAAGAPPPQHHNTSRDSSSCCQLSPRPTCDQQRVLHPWHVGSGDSTLQCNTAANTCSRQTLVFIRRHTHCCAHHSPSSSHLLPCPPVPLTSSLAVSQSSLLPPSPPLGPAQHATYTIPPNWSLLSCSPCGAAHNPSRGWRAAATCGTSGPNK
jgi:hypothetical protein